MLLEETTNMTAPTRMHTARHAMHLHMRHDGAKRRKNKLFEFPACAVAEQSQLYGIADVGRVKSASYEDGAVSNCTFDLLGSCTDVTTTLRALAWGQVQLLLGPRESSGREDCRQTRQSGRWCGSRTSATCLCNGHLKRAVLRSARTLSSRLTKVVSAVAGDYSLDPIDRRDNRARYPIAQVFESPGVTKRDGAARNDNRGTDSGRDFRVELRLLYG
jgi:hypothetical protein